LLEAKAAAGLHHVTNNLGVEAKVPYDLVAVACYDGARSIGSCELHQEGCVPVAIAFQRQRARRRPLVDNVASRASGPSCRQRHTMNFSVIGSTTTSSIIMLPFQANAGVHARGLPRRCATLCYL